MNYKALAFKLLPGAICHATRVAGNYCLVNARLHHFLLYG